MTLDECKKLPTGTAVIFEGKLYDFGYISITNHAVIYGTGERNMQDSIAVNPDHLTVFGVTVATTSLNSELI